jgi:hypothetical protein
LTPPPAPRLAGLEAKAPILQRGGFGVQPSDRRDPLMRQMAHPRMVIETVRRYTDIEAARGGDE